MRRWRGFWRLSASQRWLLVQALILLPLSALAMRLIGFRRCVSLLSQMAPRERMNPEKSNAETPVAVGEGALRAVRFAEGSWAQAVMTTRMVEMAATRGLWKANCLQRSVVLWWLLRRQGIGSRLQIGVRKERRLFQAHAWIEFENVVLNDKSDVSERFRPFPSLLGV